MTRALPTLLLLVSLPSLALGQSHGILNEPDSLTTIRANEVEVGLGTKLMQVVSIAFNPWQHNTDWPLFAYPVSNVFSSRTCDSLTASLAGEVAFVRPASLIVQDKPREFLGIQIDNVSQLLRICDSGNHVKSLQDLLPNGIAGSTKEWYLLSERPLKNIESSFRTSSISNDPTAANRITNVTEDAAFQ